jgi:sugar lactone lactonase YvrE
MTRVSRATAAIAAMLITGLGARAAQQEPDPPQPSFQLGDSVTMPVRTATGAHESAVAFYIAEKDLLPESVAFDAKDGSFYVGSTRKGKIVRIDAKGNAADFVAPRQEGLWQVIGIKIHPTRRVLWACSFDGANLEGFQKKGGNASGVFAFNLDTGKLIQKWVLDAPGEVHAFNDLVLTRGNDAYITHMFDEPAIYLNGITITPDERTLFVAGNEGIQAIDIAARKGRLLAAPEDEPMGVIDGLYFYRGGLLGMRGNSVNRYRLDDALGRVIMTDVIEQNHPLMNVPTTGVVVNDEFYYVANSQFDAVNPDGSLKTAELTEPVILKLKLR